MSALGTGTPATLHVVTQEDGGLAIREWSRNAQRWLDPHRLLDNSKAPTPPTFMDILSATSGSDLRGGPAIVTDGLLPSDATNPPERIVWSLLPR